VTPSLKNLKFLPVELHAGSGAGDEVDMSSIDVEGNIAELLYPAVVALNAPYG
jgi:hypothetical protein